ncbi:MAG: hypothetical protein C0467_06295 [Planctomycetaceae bacterium]|nr:hypothetical protein [Planctomycetaceae bacterium]
MIVNAEKVRFHDNDYPSGDGKPVAETDLHRDVLLGTINKLEHHFATNPDVYVSGNLLVYYEKGNKKRRVAPDVFVVRGIAKGSRPNYLVWEEKPLDVVIEVTSKRTKAEDTKKKWTLYQDTLKVKEYFLFDPYGDYLKPSLQGFSRVRGKFKPIEFVNDRLPSAELGLHLQRDGLYLRLWERDGSRQLLTTWEQAAIAESRANAAKAENQRLRRELEQLRGKRNGK